MQISKTIWAAPGGLLWVALLLVSINTMAQRTEKPPLHGNHWMAVTGRPLAAEAGAQIFQQGGNAIDAACAMLAAACTMHIVLTWGGEARCTRRTIRLGGAESFTDEAWSVR